MIFIFLFIAAFSLAASILKYSSTSSTEVSSFFFFTPGALFLTGSLQGSESPSLAGFGFKKGNTRFVSPRGTIVYGTQFEILICGNGTFFLFQDCLHSPVQNFCIALCQFSLPFRQ